MRGLLNYRHRKTNSSGFSILELAAVIVIAGLVMAPAVSIYKNESIKKDVIETENHMGTVSNRIGGFRAVYGRYPCPAARDAAPGTVGYGHEDCKGDPAGKNISVGSCAGGVCRYNSKIGGKYVLVGSLPFKTLNLPEEESFDGHANRYTYAVTSDLTSSKTFSLSTGGIGVVDTQGDSIVNPADTAQFIIISHGANKAGGYTRDGKLSVSCASVPVLEQENCDGDGVFVSALINDNLDDHVSFFSSVLPSEWQVSDADKNSIHLKNTNSIAVNAAITEDLSAAERTKVDKNTPDAGSIMAREFFKSDRLCELNETDLNVDCFSPSLIGGQLTFDGTRYEAKTLGEGMSCYDPSSGKDQFLVGIKNRQPVCVDEIYMSCPEGQFVKEIDVDGYVVCDQLKAKCPAQAVQATCGDNRTISETVSGAWAHIYSGECRKIQNYDSTYFKTALAGKTVDEIKTFIDSLNAKPRTIEECGPIQGSALVRDSYQCLSDGTWDVPVSNEKTGLTVDFPSEPSTVAPWLVENNYGGADLGNSNDSHDCWCREDYRVVTGVCSGGKSGERVYIQKHACPQTSHQWTTVYTSEEGCGCTPGTAPASLTCNQYYDYVNGKNGTNGLSGTVDLVYDITCSGNNLVVSKTPSSIDAKSCKCLPQGPSVTKKYCDTGETNKWTWTDSNGNNINFDGVASIDVTEWICPGTISGGLPDPGKYTGSQTITGPACTCEGGKTDVESEYCQQGLTGTGAQYLKSWDCKKNDWEPKGEWKLIQKEDCHACEWQAPAGDGVLKTNKIGFRKGKQCACGSTPTPCYESAGGNPPQYRVWSSCQCIPQN